MPGTLNSPCDAQTLAGTCERWKILELSLFGSAARGDMHRYSDIDILVTFAPDAPWSLFDLARAKRDFEQLLGRRVDLIERSALEQHHNPFLRASILRDAKRIYPAA